MRIRPANGNDRRAILELHRKLYIAHAGSITPPKMSELLAYRNLEEALKQDVDALLGSGASVILVAELDNEIVGYITGHAESDPARVHSNKGVVEDWYVETAHQGSGIGRKLMATLEEIFQTAGCTLMESATFPFNPGARIAHEKFGFEEYQVRYRKTIERGR